MPGTAHSRSSRIWSPSRRSAVLLAPVGVLAGHGLASVVPHLRGVATHRLLGWTGLGEVAVPLAALGVLLAVAVQPGDTPAAGRRHHVPWQLASQLLLIGLVEAVEIVGAATPTATPASLHDPVVWLGLSCQVAAAIAVATTARALRRTIVTRLPSPRQPLAITTVAVRPGDRAAGLAAVSLPRPIVHRGPPRLVGPRPARN